MRIIIRLPNWLGDVVMAAPFLEAVRDQFPGADISAIIRKELAPLTDYLPGIDKVYEFSKKDWPGLKGAYRFGRFVASEQPYDLFFCLPDSFSSATMAFGTKAQYRIGYKKELRSPLLTTSYHKPHNLHRVEEYLNLLSLFTGRESKKIHVSLPVSFNPIPDRVVVNLNSDASSRQVPVAKSRALLTHLLESSDVTLAMIGAPRHLAHVNEILDGLKKYQHRIENFSGQTDLHGLVDIMATSSLLLTTDSGPAHLANAIGLPQVVLFGAGNEKNTSPYHRKNVSIVRLGLLPCEPCVKNTCRFESPKCLELLDTALVTNQVLQLLKTTYMEKLPIQNSTILKHIIRG